jgi:DNA-binding PadR family transcriptional regulator
MSQSHDKRRRSDLDLFVLALIECGVSTPYDLKMAARLSPGATIPVLARLLEAGFIVQSKPGTRGRTAHKITAAGRKPLRSGWRELIEQGPSGDLDADLRTALLALWIGNDHRAAEAFLRKSSDQMLSSTATVEEPVQPNALPSLAGWYRTFDRNRQRPLPKGNLPPRLPWQSVCPGADPTRRIEPGGSPKLRRGRETVPKGLHGVLGAAMLRQVASGNPGSGGLPHPRVSGSWKPIGLSDLPRSHQGIPRFHDSGQERKINADGSMLQGVRLFPKLPSGAIASFASPAKFELRFAQRELHPWRDAATRPIGSCVQESLRTRLRASNTGSISWASAPILRE